MSRCIQILGTRQIQISMGSWIYYHNERATSGWRHWRTPELETDTTPQFNPVNVCTGIISNKTIPQLHKFITSERADPQRD